MSATATDTDLITRVEEQPGWNAHYSHPPMLLPRSQQIVFDYLQTRLNEPSARLVLLGHAGMGKSTLMRELALQLQAKAFVLAPITPYSSFSEFMLALVNSMDEGDDQEVPEDAEELCKKLSDAGTPLILLIDNALAWPPFLLIELTMLSRSSDIRLVFTDRPGLAPHTETLSVADEDVRELVPFTRAEIEQFTAQQLINPATGRPLTLRSGASDRIWHYSGGLPHLASLLCDKLSSEDSDEIDVPITSQQVDILASIIGLTERDYLDSISAAEYDMPTGADKPERRVLSALNTVSLMAASISALAIVSIVVAQQYSYPLAPISEVAVVMDLPAEPQAVEFASLGNTLDQQLIDSVESPSTQLIVKPAIVQASLATDLLTPNDAAPQLIATSSQVAMAPIEVTSEQFTMLVALDLTQMLDVATEHMEAKRYTVPKGDNAFETFSQVLARAPSNDQAVTGLKTIHAKYVRWGRDAMKKHEWQKATRYFRRANQVLPRHKETQILLKEAETRVFWLLTFSSSAKTSVQPLPERKVNLKPASNVPPDNSRSN